jgi:TatA/E family protein of Tat protein translocase
MGIESPIHLLFLGAVALLVLGPKRLPELAKALGKGIREFREAIDTGENRETSASSNGAPPSPAQATAPPPQLPPGPAPAAPPPED